MEKLREKLQPYMLRPFIYMTFTRFLLSLCALLLVDFFLSPHAGRSLKPDVFLFGSILFAILAWIAWLRLDGIKLPKFMMLRINPRKKPGRMYGDMIDFMDEHPQVNFEDLADDEKDLCLLGADAVCALAFLLLSLAA